MNSHGVKYIISKALKDFQYKQNMSGLETFLEFVDVIFLKYTKEFLKESCLEISMTIVSFF